MENNIIINILRFKELRSFFEEISDFPYVMIKGEALSLQAYGECGRRRCGDIDLLVSRENVIKFEEILKSNGFTNRNNLSEKEYRFERRLCLVGSHQMPQYIKKTSFGDIEIDLNFDIFWGQYTGKRENIAGFIDNSICTSIYGVDIRILTPLYALIQLLLHHYKEMNSIFHLINFNTIQSQMFRDVFFLIKNNENVIRPKVLGNICKEMKIEVYAYYVLYYTGLLMDNSYLNSYLNELETGEVYELLDRYGLEKSEYGIWRIPFEDRLDNNELSRYILPYLSKESMANLDLNNKIFLGRDR